LTYSRLIVDL